MLLFIIYLLFFPSSFFFPPQSSSSSFALLHLPHLFFCLQIPSSFPIVLPDWPSVFLRLCLSFCLSLCLFAVFSLYVAYNLNYLCLLIFRSGKKCRRVKELKMTGVAWMEGCEEMSAEIPLCCVCSGFLNESLLNIYQRGNEILIMADNPISQM